MTENDEYSGFDTRGTSIDDAFIGDFENEDDVDETIEDDYSEGDIE